MAINPKNIYDPSGSQQSGPIQTYIGHVVSIKDPKNEGRIQIRPQGVSTSDIPDGQTGPVLPWVSHLGATTNHGASNACHPGDKVMCHNMGAHGHHITHKFENPEHPRAGPHHDKNLYPTRGPRIPMNDGKPGKIAPNNNKNQDKTDATQTPETYVADCNSKKGQLESMKKCHSDKTQDPWGKKGPPKYATK